MNFAKLSCINKEEEKSRINFHDWKVKNDVGKKKKKIHKNCSFMSLFSFGKIFMPEGSLKSPQKSQETWPLNTSVIIKNINNKFFSLFFVLENWQMIINDKKKIIYIKKIMRNGVY